MLLDYLRYLIRIANWALDWLEWTQTEPSVRACSPPPTSFPTRLTNNIIHLDQI